MTTKSAPSSWEKTTRSFRTGSRATIYDVRRDPELQNKDVIRDKTKPVFPFIGGSKYKGEWKDDQKDGFGSQVNPDGTKYEGEWANNKKQGRGTLFVLKQKKYIKQYVGEWREGRKEGYGIYYYSDGSVYRGSWVRDKRSGNGRLDFVNGDYYMGEWENDSQNGFGTLHYANGNIYEGLWLNGMKEGPGRFFYASTHKVYEGEWSDDNPRCGEYREPSVEEENRFGNSVIRKETFTLPALGLQDARGVLDLSVTSVRIENAVKRGMSSGPTLSQEALVEAKEIFSRIDSRDIGILPWYHSGDVFLALGIDTTQMDMLSIVKQLEIGQQGDLTFPEIVDVAMCILSQ